MPADTSLRPRADTDTTPETTRIYRLDRALTTFMPALPKLALIGICCGTPIEDLATFCGCDRPAAHNAVDYLLDGGYLMRFEHGHIGLDPGWAGTP